MSVSPLPSAEHTQFTAFYHRVIGCGSSPIMDLFRRVALDLLKLSDAPTQKTLAGIRDDLFQLETLIAKERPHLKDCYPSFLDSIRGGLSLDHTVAIAKRLKDTIQERYTTIPVPMTPDSQGC